MNPNEEHIDSVQRDIESFIEDGEVELAYHAIIALQHKAQTLRKQVAKDDQEIRKLMISVNRKKDLIETIDNLAITLYSKAIHTAKGSNEND